MSLNLAPITITGASFTLDLQGVNFESIAWIEFLNESPYTLPLQAGGVNINLPAWYDYPLEVNRQVNGVWIPWNGAQAPVVLSPMLLPTLSSNISTKLLVTLYQKGQVPAITVPQPLFRQGWVPNTVNNTGGTATSIVNDGNPIDTQFIESTYAGGTQSSVSITNRGDAYFNGTVEIHTGIVANLMTAETGNDVAMHAGSGQRFVTTINGVDTFSSSGTTTKVLANTFSLPFGIGIKAIAYLGPFSANNTQQTYNHNLGVNPAIVLTVVDGVSSTSAIVKVDFTTFTTTTFKATGSIAGPFTFYALAIA